MLGKMPVTHLNLELVSAKHSRHDLTTLKISHRLCAANVRLSQHAYVDSADQKLVQTAI